MMNSRDVASARQIGAHHRGPSQKTAAIGFGCTCQPQKSSATARCPPKLCKACVQLAAGDGKQRWIQHSGVAATDEALYAVSMSKRKTQPPVVTPQFVKSLCEPHLIPRVLDDGSSCAPFEALPDRRSLPVDHRCRCSTNLMQLATRVTKAMDELELKHWDEVAQLKKQVALANAISREWQSAFGRTSEGGGKQTTPLDVWSELEALKKEKEDWLRERQLLRRQQEATALQVDALIRQVR